MILLAGADLVLPDRVVNRGSLIIDGDRIVAVEPRVIDTPAGATRLDLDGAVICPGFVDVHVHGLEGHDVLDGGTAIAQVASRLPRYGVTSFCPTSIACDPSTLALMLQEVAALNLAPSDRSARVLPAHLESNFINPEYKGAQPPECLRLPKGNASKTKAEDEGEFTGDEILNTIGRHREQIGIVTLAPELDGALDLVRDLTRAGHRVSVGHAGATYDQTLAAIDAGVCHATHLFNRMSSMTARQPGVAGAVLRSERVLAELICDGFHVHPALMGLAIRAKGARAIMAITDGTAGAGLPVGSRTRLGSRTIVVTPRTAELEDGTLAGSVLTMDAAFRRLVWEIGVSLADASHMCATTPAKHMGLVNVGEIAAGAIADLVVLDRDLRVRYTYVRGQRVQA